MGTTREGQAISRAGSAVLFAALYFLLSAPGASARPSFDLAEHGARAGDAVHFSISGARGYVSFEVYVDGDYVLDGTGEDAVSGTFTMPDLGADGWTVGVAAVVWDSDRRRKIERSIDYLGRALPVARPPAPTVAPAAPAPPVPSPPAPGSSPARVEGGSAAPSAPPPIERPRWSRTGRAIEGARHVSSDGRRSARSDHPRDRRKRHRATRRHGRRSVRWVRLPYPRRASGARSGDGLGYVALNAIAPHSAVLAAKSVPAGSDGADAAIAVPALLALAALTLAGTAVLRRRRLASRLRRG